MTSIVTTALTFLSDAAVLTTKALPSEEQQLAAFKIRSPWIYMVKRNRMIWFMCRQCKKLGYFNALAVEYVKSVTGDLPVSEQVLLQDLVVTRLNQK